MLACGLWKVHEFGVSYTDGRPPANLKSTFLGYGEPGGDTIMAKSVGASLWRILNPLDTKSERLRRGRNPSMALSLTVMAYVSSEQLFLTVAMISYYVIEIVTLAHRSPWPRVASSCSPGPGLAAASSPRLRPTSTARGSRCSQTRGLLSARRLSDGQSGSALGRLRNLLGNQDLVLEHYYLLGVRSFLEVSKFRPIRLQGSFLFDHVRFW